MRISHRSESGSSGEPYITPNPRPHPYESITISFAAMIQATRLFYELFFVPSRIFSFLGGVTHTMLQSWFGLTRVIQVVTDL